MEIFKLLEEYTVAQKIVGFQLMTGGLILLIIAGLCWLLPTHSFLDGLKFGCFFTGIFLILGGVVYRSYSCPKVLASGKKIYQSSQSDFVSFENERMKKVFESNPKIKTTVIVLMVLLIGFVLLSPLPFWNGVALALILMLIEVFIIESLSYHSIQEYYNVLITLKQ